MSAETPPHATPGQCAYEAFWRTIAPDFRDPWATLPPPTQARWEAAAQAVLALTQEDATLTLRQSLELLDTILDRLARLRAALHHPLNRADLAEAQACLEDVALRLREDVGQMEDTP